MHLPTCAVARLRHCLLAATAGAGLFSASPTASAVDKYWGNVGTDFNTTTNWAGGLPGTADRAIFGTTTVQPVLSGPIGILGATFHAPGTTLSGASELSLLSNVTNNDYFAALAVAGTGATTVSAPLVLGLPAATGNAGFSAVLGGELVVSGDISGSRGIQKMNYGTVTLSGNNTFTGGVLANGGNGNFGFTRLNINSNTALGTGTFSVGQGNGGSTIGNTSGAARTLANAINLGAGGGLTAIFDLPANGSGDLTFTGASSLSGAASQSGTVTVIGGTLTLRSGLAESAATQSFTKNGSGTLVLGGAVTNTGTATFSGGALVLDASTGGAFANSTLPLALVNTNFTYRGATSGTSAQTMSGTSTFAGRSGITVDGNGGAATLTLADIWTRNTASTLAIKLAGDATLAATPPVSGGGLVIGSGTAAFATVTDAGGTGFAGFDAGKVVRYTETFPMTAADSGNFTNYVTKVGDADYVGNTLTLVGGNRVFNTLQLDTSGGAGVLDLNGAVLSFTDKALLVTGDQSFTVQNGALGAAGELVVHQFATGALTVSSLIGGLVSNNASVTKDGPGTLVLAGANLYSGATTANEGTLRITGSVKGNVVATGSTVATSGTVILESASAVTQGTVTVAGVGTLNQTVANAISGTTAVTVNGFFRGATANLSLANDYSGTTTLTNGFLNIGDPAAIGTGTLSIGGGVLDNTSGAAMTLANNNPVTFTGGTVFAGTRSLNLGTGAINLGTTNRTLVVLANTLTFGGSASGTGGGITKAGAGTLALDNANTYTGTTTVQGGILLLNNATALPGGIGSTGGLANLIISGGVIGLGAGDFTRVAGSGVDQVRWSDSGGFAAFGADRIVNLGGSAAALTWNSTNFLTGQTGNPAVFVLGAASADKTVHFQNPIVLATGGTNTRVVKVDDGAAAIDARLSGDLTHTSTSATLTKIGDGALVLSGAQNYNVLNTNAGTTHLDNALGTGASTLNANATTNIHVSQTLAALNIGDGAVVTLGGPVIPFAEGAGEGFAATGVTAVPEPGSVVLLLAGVGVLLGRRKRVS